MGVKFFRDLEFTINKILILFRYFGFEIQINKSAKNEIKVVWILYRVCQNRMFIDFCSVLFIYCFFKLVGEFRLIIFLIENSLYLYCVFCFMFITIIFLLLD